MSRQEDFKKAADDYVEGEPDGAQKIVGQVGFEFGAEYGYQYAQTHPNWISVEEELPKERGQYFVYTAADQSWQSEWMQDKSGEWHWFCSPMTVGTIANVTHWMPIVPPRKEDKI